MEQLYDTTTRLPGKFKQAEKNIKYNNGVLLISEECQMGRWGDGLEELLIRPAPSNPPDILMKTGLRNQLCKTIQRINQKGN